MIDTINNLHGFLDWLPYIVIPFVSALVGWITNILAIKMTFYPIDYKGIRPFGWQGIIPKKAPKMAIMSVDLMTKSLIDPQEIFGRLDPKTISEKMKNSLEPVAERITDEVMNAQIPEIWKNLTYNQKDFFYESVRQKLPIAVKNTMADVQKDVNSLLDLKKLTIHALLEDKSITNRIFLNVGSKEFKFIEQSGLYFGFLFGLFQLTVTLIYNPFWMMPLAGLCVGYLTNFLAIKLIFKPTNPKKIGPFVLQGLFLKRQKEVAREYAEIVTSKILTTENLFDAIFRNPSSSQIRIIIYEHISELIDNVTGKSRKILELLKGEKVMKIMKNIALFRFMQELPICLRDTFRYAEDNMKLKENLRTKMASIPSEEFVGFLRPVFQEDELKLILIGAFLGSIAGAVQYLISFA